MFHLFKKKKKKHIIEKENLENDKIANFSDINLEVYVRKLIKKEDGDIFLSDTYNIKELNFLSWPLIDIRGIENMPNVESLNLYYSRITNITYLKYLNNLKELNLSWIDSLSELRSISELKHLEKLTVSYSPRINDFSIIRFIKSLKYLDFSENRLNIADYIKELLHLETLILSKNNLSSIDLKENIKIKYLDLSANKISKISFLSNLTELEYLDLSVNSIEDISSLNNLSKLKKLDLRGNNLNYKNEINKNTLSYLKSINCKIKK